MSISILKKTAVVFSILAMGFLFQNCSSGGSGTGGGSGAGPNDGSNPNADSGPTCKNGFVLVPGNSDYDTQDFCVMKYEAQNDSSNKAISQINGTPWANINRAEAVAACEASELQLLTNDHWQTIARNIESVDENWATNTRGNTNGLNRGHSNGTAARATSGDNNPCSGTGQDATACGVDIWHVNRRTHKLSNDQVIWDIAGNVSEWVSYNNGDWGDHDNDPDTSNTNENPVDYGSGDYISRLTDASPNEAKTRFGPSIQSSPGSNFNLTDDPWGNLGRLYTGTAGGVRRGGYWISSTNAGVFAADLRFSPSGTFTSVGFRCFYNLPE